MSEHKKDLNETELQKVNGGHIIIELYSSGKKNILLPKMAIILML